MVYLYKKKQMTKCGSIVSSVSMYNSSSDVSNNNSACVCFTLPTVSVTFRQVATASCSAMLNCIFPNSRLDKSITSLINFSRSSEFCWMMSVHCLRVESSKPSSVSNAEKPDRALRGVRISWLIFDKNILLARVAFSAL